MPTRMGAIVDRYQIKYKNKETTVINLRGLLVTTVYIWYTMSLVGLHIESSVLRNRTCLVIDLTWGRT